MENKIVLYVAPGCPYCQTARTILTSKNIAFAEIVVDQDDVKNDWLRRFTGNTDLPKLFIDCKSLGGLEELQEMEANGTLNKILSLAPNFPEKKKTSAKIRALERAQRRVQKKA